MMESHGIYSLSGIIDTDSNRSYDSHVCPCGRYSHASVLLPGGEVLVCGGFGEGGKGKPHSRLSSVLVITEVEDGDNHWWTCKELETQGDSPGKII